MAAGGDVAAGEADDLAVLEDSFALADVAQGELVAEVDPVGQDQAPAVVLDFQPRGQVACGYGNVIFGTQMDGNFGKRNGRHEPSPLAQSAPRIILPYGPGQGATASGRAPLACMPTVGGSCLECGRDLARLLVALGRGTATMGHRLLRRPGRSRGWCASRLGDSTGTVRCRR